MFYQEAHTTLKQLVTPQLLGECSGVSFLSLLSPNLVPCSELSLPEASYYWELVCVELSCNQEGIPLAANQNTSYHCHGGKKKHKTVS